MAAKKKRSKSSSANNRSTKKPASRSTPLDTCFVMMPFKEPFETYYRGIFCPAILACNLTPVRADDLFRPSPIVSDMWQMIQKSKILVAELTTKNANVFYELGLAHAIGKPIIMIAESMDDVPFDLQQLRMLLYDKNNPSWGSDLQSDIEQSISETIASPEDAIPTAFKRIVKSQAPKQDELHSRISEIEKNIRLLNNRTNQIYHSTPSVSGRLSPRQELETIDSDEELGDWVRKWRRRGVSVKAMSVMVSESEHIPAFSADDLNAMAYGDKETT